MSLQPEGALGFMPFYYQRFAWSTRGWPADAAMAYLFLLCEQYSNGGLNPDPHVLEEIAPGTVAHWDRIKRKFTQGPDGLLRNIRCEEIRSRSLAAGDRKRQQARNAAAMRWHSGSNARAMQNDANDNDNDNDNESDTDSEIGNESESVNSISLNGLAVEPVSSVNDPKPNRRPTIPQAALDALWLKFPRKVGRKKAMALLDKGVREIMEDIEHDEPTDALIYMGERIDALAQQHRTTDPKFIPHPATWLGQGRYLDPEETA
jgi:uncharacterized protein YdaU (DUF1376 family)